MANPNQVTGNAKIRIDGASMPVAEKSTVLTPGGVSRTEVKGDYEVGNFMAGNEASKLEFGALTKSSFDPIAFGKIDDATVHIEFDNGSAYVIRHAWAEKAPDANTSDGKASCVMYGQPAERVR